MKIPPKKTLNVWDIDGTLFNTSAKVGVKDVSGSVTKILDHGEYNTYKLKDGEKYDYAQFRSGEVFKSTAQPVSNVLDRAIQMINRQGEKADSIILTARADFDDKEPFLQTFRDHGFPVDKVYIERAGNLAKYNELIKPTVSKAVILRKYIMSGKYNRIRMWDDSAPNLEMLMKLGKLHPEIEMIGYLVNKDGSVARYKQGLLETIEIPHSGMTFSRKLMPQIPKEQHKKFFSYLRKENIKWHEGTVIAGTLKPTQDEFNLEKIANYILHRNVLGDHIIVSNDGYVLDGHHRWIVQYNLDKSAKVKAYIIDLPIVELMAMAKRFSGVQYRGVTDNIKKLVRENLNQQIYK